MRSDRGLRVSWCKGLGFQGLWGLWFRKLKNNERQQVYGLEFQPREEITMAQLLRPLMVTGIVAGISEDQSSKILQASIWASIW